METKTCNTCKIEKSLDEYHINRKLPDGLVNRCKPCCAVIQRNNYLKNKGLTPIAACNDEYTIEGARELLINMGFDVDDEENPVHLQFDELLATKYNLK